MEDKNTTILSELEKNSELSLLQGQEMIKSVDGLEPALEGILLKTNELVDEQKKTNEILNKDKENEDKKLQTVADEMTVTLKGLKGDQGDKGDSPSEEELVKLIIPLIPEPVKGDSPTEEELLNLIQPLIPEPIKGDDGDDYILTEQDKIEIASNITVPVVEKIIEKTEVIKEVTKKETPKQLKEKIEKLGINYDSLSNAPDFNQIISVAKQSSKTVSLQELDNVDLSGVTITDGKYVLGSGGGGSQTLANTSDATSHTVTLSASGGSIKLIEGSNITLTTAGTGLDGEVTIAATGGGGGHTIQDEGTPLTQRTNLNFVGAGVTVTDGGAGPDSTIVTISGGAQTIDYVTNFCFMGA